MYIFIDPVPLKISNHVFESLTAVQIQIVLRDIIIINEVELEGIWNSAAVV